MYALIGTARLNDVDPQTWLADVPGRIADTPQGRLEELLPWNRSPEQRHDLAAEANSPHRTSTPAFPSAKPTSEHPAIFAGRLRIAGVRSPSRGQDGLRVPRAWMVRGSSPRPEFGPRFSGQDREYGQGWNPGCGSVSSFDLNPINQSTSYDADGTQPVCRPTPGSRRHQNSAPAFARHAGSRLDVT